MAKVLSDLRTHVRAILDDQSQADWTNTEIDRVINNRYHRVVTAVMTVFEDYYMTTAQWNSVADQEEYGVTDGLPSDVFKLRRIELNYDVATTTNAPVRVLPVSVGFDAIRRDLGYKNAGIGLSVMGGAAYYTYGYGSSMVIGFIPKPNKAGTNAFKIWYVPVKADLSGDSTVVDIPYVDRYWVMISEGAAGDLLRFGQQDMGMSDKYDVKFEANLAKMMEELEDKIAEESKSVLDVSGEYIEFDL